jgi:hypothetical protein
MATTHKWDMYKFLTTFGQTLISNFVDPANELVSITHKSDDPIISPIPLKRAPYAAQSEVIEGIVKHLHNSVGRPSALLNGQMGVGKSIMGAIVAGKLHYLSGKKDYNVLIGAPAQLGPKWAREVELTLPGAHCWVWNSDFRKYGFPYVLAGAKAPTSKKRFIVRDIDGEISLLTMINKEQNQYELTPLDMQEFRGLTYYFIPYSVLRMHYHTKNYFINGFSTRPEVNKFYNNLLIRKNEFNEIVFSDDDEDSSVSKKIDKKAEKCRNKKEDAIALCPRCGSPFKVEKANDKGWRYLTVEELEKKNGTVTCKAPRFPKKQITTIDINGNKVTRSAGAWGSTPSEKGKTKLCGEVFRANVRNRAVNEPEDGAEAVEKFVDETGSDVEMTPHKLAHFVSPAYRYKKKLKKNKVIDFALPDEVHALKNDGPQGKTGRWMMTSAQKVLCLTGTLTGGYATDLFYLLWSIAPKELRKLGFTYSDVGKFEDKYGPKEVTYTTAPAIDKKTGEKVMKTERRSRRMPGISGRVYSDFLVNKSCFLMMADLHQALPAYNEYLELISMSSEMEDAYLPLVANFRAEMSRLARKDFASMSGLVSSAMHVWCSWLDCFRADKISGKIKRPKGSKGEDFVVEVCAPEIEIAVSPKEQRMIDLIRENKAEGRKVMVFMVYTDKRDCAARAHDVFTKAGLQSKVLYSNVAAKKREQWIKDNSADVDVILCNPELVKEGLDLYDFPTLVSAQPICNLYTNRQAMARSWRLGQDKDVRVHYIGYKNTIQERLMALIASKLDSALLAEGNATDSALFEISYSPDNILREMVQAILAGSDELLKLTTLGRKTNQEIIMAVSADEFAAKGFNIDEAPDTNTPVTTTEITTVADDGSVRVVYVQSYQRKGGKKVRHSLEMTSEELESGVAYQLCLFDLGIAA